MKRFFSLPGLVVLALSLPLTAFAAVDEGPISVEGRIDSIGRQNITLRTREGALVKVPRKAAEAVERDLRPGDRISVPVGLDVLSSLNPG
jgi:hypothetical protein